MKEQLNKYLKRSTLLSSARIFYVLVVLLFFYYYPKNLPKSVFAQYQQIFILVSFGSVLLSVGLPFIIGLLQKGPFLKQVLVLVRKAKLFYVIAAIIILARLFITVKPDYIQILCISLLIASISLYTVAESILIKLKKDRLVFTINILYAIFFLIIHIYFIPSFSILPLIFFWTIISAVRSSIALFVIVKNETGIHRAELSINDLLYKQWIWLATNDTVDIVNSYLDKLLLPLIISSDLFAVYIMGTYEIPIFSVIISVIGFQFNVQHSDDHSDKHTLDLFNTSAVFIACGLFPVFLYLFFYAADAFHLLLGNKYDQSIPLFHYTTLLIPVRIAYYTSIIQVKKQNKYVLYGTSLSLLFYIIFIAVLYPFWGLMGIVWATIISTYFQALYYLFITSKVVNQPLQKVFPFAYLFLLLIVNFAIMGLFAFLSQNQEPFKALVIATVPFVLCIVINYRGVYKYYTRKLTIA